MTETISTCGHDRKPIPVEQRGKHLVVDIHCHLNVPAGDQIIRAEIPNPPNPMKFMSQDSMQVNGKMFGGGIGKKLNAVDERITDMDRLGVDVQAISPSPGQYYYYAPPELGRSAAQAVNDGIAAAVDRHSDRLVGMGTVPMQNTEMAVAELHRCVNELGLRGVEIGTYVANGEVGEELAADRLRPFFAAAEELGVLVFMHPLGFSHGHRLSEHYLDNIIGNPVEASIALSHLIFGGVLDSYPGLKLCVAHGGGYLPGYWGRMDHAYRAREDCRRHINKEPSSYLRQIWLDTLVFDKDQLASLVRTHGADKLCLGTDYPFDMAEPDPVGFHEQLDETDKARILGLNAAHLLGLKLKT